MYLEWLVGVDRMQKVIGFAEDARAKVVDDRWLFLGEGLVSLESLSLERGYC